VEADLNELKDLIAKSNPEEMTESQVAEIKVSAHTGIPLDAPEIPNANETATYASPIGIPSINPLRNSLSDFIICSYSSK
ncbi:MAG TPA: hypothetical protein PLV54_03045, partial [Anaerostipes hadrus]|nr:hypothetical protein [Anaerostipes hadrus]